MKGRCYKISGYLFSYSIANEWGTTHHGLWFGMANIAESDREPIIYTKMAGGQKRQFELSTEFVDLDEDTSRPDQEEQLAPPSRKPAAKQRSAKPNKRTSKADGEE
jgi:hypothetical protein